MQTKIKSFQHCGRQAHMFGLLACLLIFWLGFVATHSWLKLNRGLKGVLRPYKPTFLAIGLEVPYAALIAPNLP
jgi:hypothetical protein